MNGSLCSGTMRIVCQNWIELNWSGGRGELCMPGQDLLAG